MATGQVTRAMVVMVQLKVKFKANNFILDGAPGVPLSDQPDQPRGHILPSLKHPPFGGSLRPGSLARDKKQDSHTTGADFCQEGGGRRNWLLLVALSVVVNYCS